MKPSCIKTLITTLTLCSTAFVYANNMQSSFSEGMNLGKGQNGKSSNVITSFNPSSVSDNYTSNPSEVNLKGNATNLSSQGMSALGKSEVGQAINTSTVNNPKVKISEDADFLKSSADIRENANVISGMKSGKQCVKQVLTKTSLTNHFCEKDQAINATCKKTMKVVWSGGKKVEDRPPLELSSKDFTITLGAYHDGSYSHGVSIPLAGYKLNFDFPEEGVITQFEIEYANKGQGYMVGYFDSNVIFEGKKYGDGHNRAIRRANGYKFNQNVSIAVKAKQKLELVVITRRLNNVGWIGGFDAAGAKIKIHYRAEVDTLNAKLEEHYTCSNKEMGDAIKISEQCTSGGGTRTFVKDGKSVQLKADCWEHTENYLINEASDNECKTYEENKNCSVAQRECILDIGGKCTRFRNTYQCSATTKTDGYLCGDEFFCSDGKCSDLEGSTNTNFGHAVSQLANLAKASDDYDYENQKFTAFTGRPMFCRKSGFGYSDCCKDSGWGNKAGLAKCNSEEQMLGQAKEKKTAVFVGTFCSRKVLGKCIQRKSSYCVFDNKLARITQVQGRSGQLGIGFGGASSPDCRGLSVDELSSIDFNNMDYSDFYEELNSNTEVPDKNQLMEYMKKSISEQMQQ